MEEPTSMDELLYFTNRLVEGEPLKAWVRKKKCPKCKKALMGKPVVKGKIKTRATEYVCSACGYTEEKVAHEESLTAEAKYTCPSCKKEGYSKIPFKWKSVAGTKALRFVCEHCNYNIDVTKKMKDKKVKKS